jgi:hypothetical protein
VLDKEGYGATMRPAAKTVIELFGRANGKRRAFLVVERTKAKQVGPAFAQLYVSPDDVKYIYSGEEILNK